MLFNNSVGGGGYYDPPGAPMFAYQRQLIFDFADAGTIYDVNDYKFLHGECYDNDTTYYPTDLYGSADLPVVLHSYTGVLNLTAGGIHPQGWYCAHSPGLSILDNGSNDNAAGCWHPHVMGPGYAAYGYDNDSWYARQREDLRQQILIYLYYKVKCLDQYSHFSMPGRLIVHPHPIRDSYDIYYNACEYADISTIAQIWNNVFAGSYGSVVHNFSFENLATEDNSAISSLIFVGTDKMFFIGTDGYIGGYIRLGGTYNGGTWVYYSPSYSAAAFFGQPYTSQVKAKSDLVASPDGTKLLYIGIDNRIYGFYILDIWNYRFFSFVKEEMLIEVSTAIGSLIFADDNNIFYIGNSGAWVSTVQGFKINWNWGWGWDLSTCVENDPAYLDSFHHGTVCDINCVASYGLTYEPNTKRLYYVNFVELLAYYQTDALFSDFTFVNPPGNILLHDLVVIGHFRIQGNLTIHYDSGITRVYFVGNSIYGDSLYIFGLMTNGIGWAILAPSYYAESAGYPISSQVSSDASGDIAVSPDGNTIAYWGRKEFEIPYIIYIQFDGVRYNYYEFKAAFAAEPGNTLNSLQFTNSGDLYYINERERSVTRLTYQEVFCNNDFVYAYEDVL